MRSIPIGVAVLTLLSTIVLAQQKPTPGYMVAEIEILDRDSLKQFSEKTHLLVKSYGGEFLSRGGNITPLSGPAPNGIVIIRFDDIEKAKSYYNSPEYKSLIPLRDKAIKYKSFLVEGGDPAR